MRPGAFPGVRRAGLLAAALALGIGPPSAPGLAAQAAQGASPAQAAQSAQTSQPAQAAQSDSGGIDDVFSGGTGDTVAPAGAATSASSALASLQATQPLTFSGTIYCNVSAAAGYSSLPSWSDPLLGLRPLYGGSVTNYIYFDSRPDQYTRFHLAVQTTFPGFALSVYELWFDYSIDDSLFFRGGQQVIGWGNGRIFSVGDLMDNSSTALSLKTYLPFGASGLTVVSMVQDPSSTAGLSESEVLKPEVAPRLDLVLGSFELSEAAVIQYDSATRLASIVKTSHFGVDLYGEVFGTWLPDTSPEISTFESAFWQTTGQKFSLYAEHYYDGSSGYNDDNRIALLASLKFNALTLGAQWNHAFTDGSGQVTPAVNITPYEHLTVSFGFPISYGANGSIYAGQPPTDFNSPFYNPLNLTNPNLASPITTWNSQRYSFFVKIGLTFNY